MPPRRFKSSPSDADKYDGTQEPQAWIEDYLQNVIAHKGNAVAAMQCFQLYLKDSARAWLRSLPRGKIHSWDDLVDTFVKNFSATFKRPGGIEQLQAEVEGIHALLFSALHQAPKRSCRSID